MRRVIFLGCIAFGAMGACHQAPVSNNGPAAICKAPAALPAGKWFTDVTNDVGFAGINGVRVSAADLDGDGWVDIVVHGAPSARDPFPAPTKPLMLLPAPTLIGTPVGVRLMTMSFAPVGLVK